MAALTANIGRIVFSATVPSAGERRLISTGIASLARLHGAKARAGGTAQFAGAVARSVLPRLDVHVLTRASAHLDRAGFRRSGPSGRAGKKVAAPFQCVVAPSIGKWTN